jgi:hypothetical protein
MRRHIKGIKNDTHSRHTENEQKRKAPSGSEGLYDCRNDGIPSYHLLHLSVSISFWSVAEMNVK